MTIDRTPSPCGTWFVALLALILSGCGSPPQIGDDKETFQAVDALYTAVGLKDPGMVARSEATFKSRRGLGKLSESASRRLDSVIGATRANDWESARVQLTSFMEGQHR